ncbi:ATP-binding protein [Phenylobacterium deserti]|uniref:ATP-binding protein n=1 Tax=Phenylobacterium deserti TaxID=1914756 RepID=UPI001F0C4725|nr:ATP-binding protein [Phenylobacterium deserti]
MTTVIVLLAACATFTLQQWAVARSQTEQIYQGLAHITAETAAPAMLRGEMDSVSAPLSALRASRRVVAAQITDGDGRAVATYARRQAVAKDEATLVVRAPILAEGHALGELTLTVDRPRLTPLLPQFLALTLVLLFGGVGLALFLARSLAHRVIAPVQHLSVAMHDVAEGGSFQPVEVKAQDELFRSLTDSFNHLLAKLGEREAELRSAMRDLETARDAANAANVLKTQFLANMSHEIRTPLNGVLAMAEVMAMGELAAVQRDRLQIIRQSGGLLLSVLNDVLDLSKIEAGKLALASEPFDLEPTIAPTVETFAGMAAAKGLDFAVEVEADAQGWWRGDAERLQQVVSNLLSNAVKFTVAGEVRMNVTLSPEGEALRISVRDTGVGIAPAKLPTLFEKFTQADNSATRRFGGTGLGLALCRELTQMMGGSIQVESQEGKGSAFTVELPLPRAGAEDQAVAADAMDEGGLRLLAAEDNPTNQQVLAAVMESLGISIDIVSDGEKAVEAWGVCDYDLILMDIQMPVMDGITAAREIRAAEARTGRARTPIVALTANALSHQVAEYLAAGMDNHVAKPIEIAKLYEAISTTLTNAATGATPAADEGGDARTAA